METRSPSVAKVITMVLFALSCVGLLLFLWLSFGGTMPFNPQGYRVNVMFQYADELAPQEDVRIAGVSVGKVVNTALAKDGNHTVATLEINRQFAPLPVDTRAILRTKTILGETYVQLTPGINNGHYLKDGAMIPLGHVVPAVQLDQIFNTFDAKTRRAFQVWQQQLAAAIKGNDQNLNDVLGNLPVFAGNASQILQVLDVQRAAVVNLVRNGGTVFGAIARDPAALQNLIRTGETTFHTTALQNQALAQTIHVFPTFLHESRLTMAALQSFSQNTNPLITQLQPAARDLGPTMRSVHILSPYLRHLFVQLGPLVTAAKTGLPATRDVINGLNPLLGQIGPFLEQLNPILGWLSIHQPLLSDFISDGAAPLEATTVAFGGGSTGHYLRQFGPVGPETLSLAPTRDSGNRGNTYPNPIWLNTQADFNNGNMPSWDCKNTGAGGDGSVKENDSPGPLGHSACWVAPPLPGTGGKKIIPRLMSAKYPSR
jgi:virulence factor Mce-like protein